MRLLKNTIERMAKVRFRVQRLASYRKLNRQSTDQKVLRRPSTIQLLSNRVLAPFKDMTGLDVKPIDKVYLNKFASLEQDGIKYTAQFSNPEGNLISIAIVNDASVADGAAEVEADGFYYVTIKIDTDSGTPTDLDTVVAAIKADSHVSGIIDAEVTGTGTDAASTLTRASLEGGE